MHIRELNTECKIVTVTLDYDELRCINNAMYQVSRVTVTILHSVFNSLICIILHRLSNHTPIVFSFLVGLRCPSFCFPSTSLSLRFLHI